MITCSGIAEQHTVRRAHSLQRGEALHPGQQAAHGVQEYWRSNQRMIAQSLNISSSQRLLSGQARWKMGMVYQSRRCSLIRRQNASPAKSVCTGAAILFLCIQVPPQASASDLGWLKCLVFRLQCSW